MIRFNALISLFCLGLLLTFVLLTVICGRGILKFCLDSGLLLLRILFGAETLDFLDSSSSDDDSLAATDEESDYETPDSSIYIPTPEENVPNNIPVPGEGSDEIINGPPTTPVSEDSSEELSIATLPEMEDFEREDLHSDTESTEENTTVPEQSVEDEESQEENTTVPEQSAKPTPPKTDMS